MNSKQFLFIGGAVLVLLAILGWVGVIGPDAEHSVFGAAWVFDKYENWAHLVLGVVALIAGAAFPASVQKPLVMVVGLVALFFGVYSAFGPVYEGKDFMGAMLQNPTDTVLHLVVGVWALVASMQKGSAHHHA